MAPAEVSPRDLRASMPLTAQWVQEQRQALGDTWVTQCVKNGMAGRPGWFYALESGHVVGAPFDWTASESALISRSLASGAKFFAALRSCEPPVNSLCTKGTPVDNSPRVDSAPTFC